MDMRELDRRVLGMMSAAPEEVRSSKFGCMNCLWSCVECQHGSMYKAQSEQDTECKAYTYYD